MADYLSGLRKLFTGSATPARQQQLEQQEQGILGNTLRQAPIQPAPVPQVPMTGIPEVDAAEMERMERQRLLEEALMKYRSGGG